MNRSPDLPGDGQPTATRVVVAAMPLMNKIDLKEQASLRYWCRMLGATPLEICRAVESVGPNPAAVRAHLKWRKDPVALLADAAHRNDVVRLGLPGDTFLLTHPQHVKHVLQDNNQNYVKGWVFDRIRPYWVRV